MVLVLEVTELMVEAENTKLCKFVFIQFILLSLLLNKNWHVTRL